MKKIVIAVVLLLCVIGSVVSAACFSDTYKTVVPEPKTEYELSELGDICEDFEIGQELYVIDSATFQNVEERHLAVSLQGVVGKTQPKIFIVTNEICYDYLKVIENNGVKLIYNDAKGEKWTIQTLLNEFKASIGDSGYTLYKPTEKGEGLNVATNLASINGWLPVPESLEQMAREAGLELKEDLTDDKYNVWFQWKFFEKYKKQFNNKAVISLKYECTGLRDLAIQQGFYVFYIDDDEDTDLFRKRVFQYSGDNTAVLGWAKYEVAYVTQASECGNYVLPSDHSHNNSVLACFKYELPEQKHIKEEAATDTTKHYCALVFSDGDNIQWIQNGYNEYFRKLALEEQFPLTWSFSPTLQEFSPITANMIYSSATQDDYFIAGVSGAGYIHPGEYPRDALVDFTDLTAANMLKCGMEYVSILDNTPEDEGDEENLKESLEYYARYDNIRGGVLSLDPSRYEGGKGKVYFVNDKPFVSNRFSLWHPDGEGTEITKEWLDQQAELVNSYPADTTSINGYSVINVHPWTISVDDLAYFVSKLDEDVELVTLDELLTKVEKNIPHEDDIPVE